MGELRGAVRSIALVTLLALAGCTSSPPVEGPTPSGASASAPVTAATTAATTAPATGLAATDPLPSVEVATGAGPSGVAATSAAPASALPESHFLERSTPSRSARPS